jgi:hypothetical protein
VRLGDTVTKGVELTERDAATVLLLRPDCVVLIVPDADIHTEPLVVGVGTNTVGEEV